jgi:uncharacterized protein (TIGR02611 family)
MVWRYLRRVAVTLAGLTITAVGVILLVLPGPGLLVIAAGLALLATEYEWARVLLHRTRHHALNAAGTATSNVWGTALSVATAFTMIAIGIAFLVHSSLPFANIGTGVGVLLGGIVLLITTTYAVRHRDALVQSSRPGGAPPS